MEPSSTLSKSAWVEAGLRALAQDGFSALKADILARRLGVSRGSFYWHFANVAKFHEAVLEQWEADAVDRPLFTATSESAAVPAKVIRHLVQQAFNAPIELERAMVAWSGSFNPAKTALERVNRRRFEELRSLFLAAGFDPSDAEMRAYMACAAYLGRVTSDYILVEAKIQADTVAQILTGEL